MTQEQAISKITELRPELTAVYRAARPDAPAPAAPPLTKADLPGAAVARLLDDMADRIAGERGVSKVSAYELAAAMPEGACLIAAHKALNGDTRRV